MWPLRPAHGARRRPGRGEAVTVAADPWRALARAIMAAGEAPGPMPAARAVPAPAAAEASLEPAFHLGERVRIGPATPWWWLRGCAGVVTGCYGPQVLVRPDGWEAAFGCRPGELVRE